MLYHHYPLQMPVGILHLLWNYRISHQVSPLDLSFLQIFIQRFSSLKTKEQSNINKNVTVVINAILQ